MGGIVTTNTSQYDFFREIALQADGKILAAGHDGEGVVMIRYNANGSIDTSFANGGYFQPVGFLNQSNFFNTGLHIVVQQNGKIVAAGTGMCAGKGKASILQLGPCPLGRNCEPLQFIISDSNMKDSTPECKKLDPK
jgi:hypothetical protein